MPSSNLKNASRFAKTTNLTGEDCVDTVAGTNELSQTSPVRCPYMYKVTSLLHTGFLTMPQSTFFSSQMLASKIGSVNELLYPTHTAKTQATLTVE